MLWLYPLCYFLDVAAVIIVSSSEHLGSVENCIGLCVRNCRYVDHAYSKFKDTSW